MEFVSILNDVMGPVMRGPSSSHTAGAHRIGTMARSLLGEAPAAARFAFDPDGSYAAGPFRDIQVTNPFGRFGMKKSFLTKCTQCHSAVHGSDLPSAGTSGGGTSRSR